MAFLRAAICAALFLGSLARPVLAQDVTLSSPDGAVEITGNLLGFDGEFYRVETQFGQLTIDGSGVSCEGPGCPSLSDFVADITLSGSPTMAEVLLPALIEGFALRNGFQTRRDPQPNGNFEYVLLRDGNRLAARFAFLINNTDQGFADLVSGEADIVMALREIRTDERAAAAETGLGDMTSAARSRVLALDAMVPVVSPQNPVQDISLAQLVGVFSGRISNWSELGGADAPISMHLPVAASGLAQAFQDKVMAPAGADLAQQIRRYDRDSTLVRLVATDPFALGIASFANTGTARTLTLTGSCGFSLRASRRSIKTEDYPLTSPMFLYLPARRLPKVARDFLSYVRGPAAQVVIRRAGFVDQAPEAMSINVQGDRLANAMQAAGSEVGLDELHQMIGALRGLKRLTTSFRFEPGSTRPDAQSRSNIQQLARALEAGVYDAQTLTFVGFSDGDGAATGNKAIALKRANAVRDAVMAAAETANLERVTLDTLAFGEAMPMACDDTEWGRQVNRRVEIWTE